MKISFLGTRGEIERRTERHFRHSSLLVSYRGNDVLLDWGLDWLGEPDVLSPKALLLTHAHPDHAGGLRGGAPCPVYATAETWAGIRRYPIEKRETVEPRRPFTVRGITLEAFTLEHSLRAPAVGYRITAGTATVFYAPDVVSIRDRREALGGLYVYVGDGAAITRRIVRRREGALIGHASIRDQLDWCAAEGVSRAIFTHCGSEIVRADERAVAAKVTDLARERGIEAQVAHDGMELRLP